MSRRKMYRPDYVTRYCERHNLDDYTDDELKCLWDIYLTYKQRGGCLYWTQFALIPITRLPGSSLDEELGTWPKYIRGLLSMQGHKLLG